MVLGCGLISFGSTKDPVVDSREVGVDTSCSTKVWEFLDQLSNYQLLEDSPPRSLLAIKFHTLRSPVILVLLNTVKLN
jgi:hypothetical protein